VGHPGTRLVASGCAGELEAIDSQLRVHGGRVEAGEAGGAAKPPPAAPSRAVLIVKSLAAPSVDEVPVVEALISSLAASGVYRVEVYEYEPLWGRPGRGWRAAELILRSLREGAALVALAPSLMAVDLASRLPWEVAEALESGLLARVEVEYDSILYLPEGGRVRLLAKANSESSYERVEWLRGRARELGVEVERVVYLEDNAAILRALKLHGPGWHRRLVPVTKVARIVLALLRCRGVGGVVELARRERARHTIYAVNLDEYTAQAMLYALRARLSRPHNPLPPREPRLASIYERGLARAVGEVSELPPPG